jgi:hypothetical protein
MCRTSPKRVKKKEQENISLSQPVAGRSRATHHMNFVINSSPIGYSFPTSLPSKKTNPLSFGPILEGSTKVGEGITLPLVRKIHMRF